jgi:tetratricopeptide (TPR) repeat protein
VAEQAVRIEPLSLVANTLLAWVGITARSGKSVEIARRVTEMEPRFLNGHWILGIALIAENKFEEGLRELKEAIEISDGLPWMVATYGCGLAYAGRTPEARAVLEELGRRATVDYVPAFLFLMLHAYLGEEEKAIQWLERSIEDGDGALHYFGIVVDWPTPMGIPERYFSPETRTRFIKRLGVDRF